MPPTVYFSGSITGGRADVPLYRRLIAALENAGLVVLAGAVGAEHIGPAGEPLSRREIFERDLGWLHDADVLVAEVSVPSHGVGYEIAYARHVRKIPVIALFRPAFTPRPSAMIGGDPGVELVEYEDPADLLPRLLESIRRLGRSPDRLP